MYAALLDAHVLPEIPSKITALKACANHIVKLTQRLEYLSMSGLRPKHMHTMRAPYEAANPAQ